MPGATSRLVVDVGTSPSRRATGAVARALVSECAVFSWLASSALPALPPADPCTCSSHALRVERCDRPAAGLVCRAFERRPLTDSNRRIPSFPSQSRGVARVHAWPLGSHVLLYVRPWGQWQSRHAGGRGVRVPSLPYRRPVSRAGLSLRHPCEVARTTCCQAAGRSAIRARGSRRGGPRRQRMVKPSPMTGGRPRSGRRRGSPARGARG